MYERAAALVLLIASSAGCDRSAADGGAPAAPPSGVVPAVASTSDVASAVEVASASEATSASAVPPGAAVPSASAVSESAAPTESAAPSSTDWWPAETKEISVSWVLHPPQLLPNIPQLVRHVEVTALAGRAHKTVAMDVRSTYFFMMYGQPDCDPKWRRERGRSIVSQLFMNGGGNFLGSVERTPTGIDVYTNDSADGICDDSPARKPCPVDRKLIGSIPLPEGVTLRVRFVEVQRVEEGKPAFREVPQTCPT